MSKIKPLSLTSIRSEMCAKEAMQTIKKKNSESTGDSGKGRYTGGVLGVEILCV